MRLLAVRAVYWIVASLKFGRVRVLASDPRVAALGLAGALPFLVTAALGHDPWRGLLLGAVLAAVACTLVGLVALPPWRDPQHSIWSGAALIVVAGVVAAVVIVLLGI